MITLHTPETLAKFAAAEAAAKLKESQDYERKWQQIMDRLEGRILCYQNAAYMAKGGEKIYTRAQVEGIRAKAMVEAKLIVWMFKDDNDALASESQREAAGTADEEPDGQAENKLLSDQ